MRTLLYVHVLYNILSLGIQVFCVVTPRSRISGSLHFEGTYCLHLQGSRNHMNMKAVYSFKMLGFRNCATQCNNLEDVNPQPRHCANFKSRILCLLTEVKILHAWLYQDKVNALCLSYN